MIRGSARTWPLAPESVDETRFSGPGAIIEAHYRAQRISAIPTEPSERATAQSVSERQARLAAVALCLRDVRDYRDERGYVQPLETVLRLLHEGVRGHPLSASAVADRFETSVRTVGRWKSKAYAIVRARALELGVLREG